MNLIRSKISLNVLAGAALAVAALSSTSAFGSSNRLCATDEPSNCYLVGDFPADVVAASNVDTTSYGPTTIRFINGGWYMGDYFIGTFGAAGWTPVVGDWDGDGIDNVGVYNNGTWVLKNSWNFPAIGHDITIHHAFGAPKWEPIVGDWNDDGKDTVGVFRDGVFKIRMIATDSSSDRIIDFGYMDSPSSSDGRNAQPIAGAFDNGPDRVGITLNEYAFYSLSNEAGTRSISYPVSSDIYIGFLPSDPPASEYFPIVVDTDDPNKPNTKARLTYSRKPATGYLQPTSPNLGGAWILTLFQNNVGVPVNGDQTYDPFPEPF